MYKPEPIDTNDVVLNLDIMDLAEKLAKNVHEVWAVGRINQGWKYGEKRDDIKKETPTLVPYEDLPEDEKEFDRATAIQTLKFIKKLGYEIIKK